MHNDLNGIIVSVAINLRGKGFLISLASQNRPWRVRVNTPACFFTHESSSESRIGGGGIGLIASSFVRSIRCPRKRFDIGIKSLCEEECILSSATHRLMMNLTHEPLKTRMVTVPDPLLKVW
uniref:Uncharacterized protein n=1 Tax=Solanum lycopersicum TaxID=4081 RepID=A0A3Q7J860_SOLLC